MVGGIIPARAGFTHAGRAGRGQARDHPRSRGVYRRRICWSGPRRGSSPLARGLRSLPCEQNVGGRIIPARAGFTRRPRRAAGPPGDHPRSRGVYEALRGSFFRAPGSSPLARGLRTRGRPPSAKTRIIPARAGFTIRVPAAARVPGDHPRSRGVYRGVVGLQRRSRRIIPARAGFTRRRPEDDLRDQDHPRSRGVYRCHRRRLRDSRRIIPARAGFTARRPGRHVVGQDHPRSRGVYGENDAWGDENYGSSPLARGLRQEPADEPAVAGIIPARAGFT